MIRANTHQRCRNTWLLRYHC